ncbi:MAG: glycosyltransferase family 39 protein, partial [Chloroflexota bacterium]
MRRILALSGLIIGLGGMFIALAGFPLVRSLMDSLAADGAMEAFTPQRHLLLRPALGLAALTALLLVWMDDRKPHWLARGIRFLKAGWGDLRAAFRPAAAERGEWLRLGFLILLAIVLRIPFLDQPLGHDEAYTYIGFARRSLWAVISDYHLPNNHVFHTLLVHIVTCLLGNAPAVMRLPAFAGGVLSVAAAYALGRIWYNRRAGWLAAGLIAVTPLLVGGSADGRGYTLLALFSLLGWVLATYLKTRPNWTGWLGLTVLGALGFYTVPVMLYPWG